MCTNPSPFFKVNENLMWRFCQVHLERASQLDNDWKMVGLEGCKGALLRIQRYVGGGNSDVLYLPSDVLS